MSANTFSFLAFLRLLHCLSFLVSLFEVLLLCVGLELIFLFVFVPHLPERARSLSFRAGVAALLIHDFVEFAVRQRVATHLLHSRLQALDVLQVLRFLLVLGAHFVVFEGLVELLVLAARLFLFKSLNFLLLGHQAHLDLLHVVVSLDHLGEEVVGARNGHLRLN